MSKESKFDSVVKKGFRGRPEGSDSERTHEGVIG